MINSPFKFLDSYTKDDSKIFFGREKETEELYRKIFENKTLLVYGVSGTGKTSIINCGLANKFNDADWLPVTIRRNQNMVESFYAALHKLSPDSKDKGKRDAKAFIKLLQSVYLDHFKPVYLLFDQFEELFIFGDEEEQKAFVDIIAEIKASDVQVKILFIMREEYLANMSVFEEKIPDLLTNRLRIEKMSTAKVKEAITGPCKYAGIEIENEAVEAIIEKLTRQGKTIELTYLQVLLDRLFHKAAQEQKSDNLQFTQSLVASLGEVSDILGDFLEEQIRQFDNPDQVLDVLKSFVSIRGTKRQSTAEEIGNHLRSLNKSQESDTLQNTIQQLVNLRILREKDENDRYELRHDALAMKIYEQISQFEKELIEIRHFIENARMNYDKRGKLLTKDDLKYLAPYEDKLYLPKAEQNLLDKSKQYHTRIKRRKRMLTGLAATIVIIIAVVYSINSYYAQKEAELQYRISQSKNIANQALSMMEDDPTMAYCLGEAAWEIHPTLEAEKAILQANHQEGFYRQKIQNHDKFPIIVAPNKEYLVSFSENANSVFLYEYNGTFIKELHHEKAIVPKMTYFMPDNHGLVTYSLQDSLYKIWNLEGGLLKKYDTIGNLFFRKKQDELSFFTENKEEFILHEGKWKKTDNDSIQYFIDEVINSHVFFPSDIKEKAFAVNTENKVIRSTSYWELTSAPKEGIGKGRKRYYRGDTIHPFVNGFYLDQLRNAHFMKDISGYDFYDFILNKDSTFRKEIYLKHFNPLNFSSSTFISGAGLNITKVKQPEKYLNIFGENHNYLAFNNYLYLLGKNEEFVLNNETNYDFLLREDYFLSKNNGYFSINKLDVEKLSERNIFNVSPKYYNPGQIKYSKNKNYLFYWLPDTVKIFKSNGNLHYQLPFPGFGDGIIKEANDATHYAFWGVNENQKNISLRVLNIEEKKIVFSTDKLNPTLKFEFIDNGDYLYCFQNNKTVIFCGYDAKTLKKVNYPKELNVEDNLFLDYPYFYYKNQQGFHSYNLKNKKKRLLVEKKDELMFLEYFDKYNCMVLYDETSNDLLKYNLKTQKLSSFKIEGTHLKKGDIVALNKNRMAVISEKRKIINQSERFPLGNKKEEIKEVNYIEIFDINNGQKILFKEIEKNHYAIKSFFSNNYLLLGSAKRFYKKQYWLFNDKGKMLLSTKKSNSKDNQKTKISLADAASLNHVVLYYETQDKIRFSTFDVEGIIQKIRKEKQYGKVYELTEKEKEEYGIDGFE